VEQDHGAARVRAERSGEEVSRREEEEKERRRGRWRVGLACQRGEGNTCGATRAERELGWECGSGASWALRSRELGREGGFWAGSGEKEREEEGQLGWAGAGVCGLRWVGFSSFLSFSISYFKPN
jgi:hypothetical protein